MPALPALPRPPALIELLRRSLRQRVADRLQNARIPAFTVPRPIAGLVAWLPQQPPSQALALALNLALGRILPRDALSPLTGRHLQMRVLDGGLTLDFTLTDAGFRRAGRAAGMRADLIISATARDFLALALREEDPDTLFFSRRLRMEGDTDLGLLVKNTLDAVDWSALKARLGGTRQT